MKIPTFLYFMNEYRDLLQMSLTDNIMCFDECESNETKKKLLMEVEVIEQNLKLEDWEMEKSIASLCSRYSKRRLKKIVYAIQNELKL